MDYRLEDLLDIPLMQTLQDKLNEIYSFPSAIVDNEGKILTAVAWQDICTKFHRTNPLSEKECIKSDLYILEHLHEANPAVCYLCPHGLIDNAMPIVIAGKHLGNFFTGQFFLEKPDLAYFKNQAKVYGFDEQAYLEAVKSVPIWSQMKLSQYLDFIKVFIDIITGIGLNQLNALEAGKAIKESLEKTNIILDTAITESKRAAEALRESEQRWQFALEGAGNGVWDWNARTNEVFFSRKWKEMLGYKEDEIGNTLDEWSNRIHPDDVPHCFDDLNRHFRKETTHYQNEHRVLCKDGSYKWIADCGKVVEWDANGKPLRVISTHSDITERKKAEQALFQSEEKFSKAFLTAPYAIIITTVENTKVIEITDAFTVMTGYTREEVLSDSFSISKLWVNIDDRTEWIRKLINGEKLQEKEVPYKRKNGENFIGLFSAKIINIADQQYVLSSINDISKLKNTEQELIIAKERAEESDRLKSAFLANMSHEIRTPMNGILGFAHLLKEPNLSGEEQQEYIRIIEKSGIRMLNLINDIVDISKIESGQMEITYSESNINEQIQFMYTILKPEAELHGIEILFRNTLSSEQAIIRTDHAKFYAILMNLVKNAIKYTKKGYVEFGYAKRGNYLEFFVKDTGIGIPKDRQEAIFQRFIHADISNKHALDGAGLGLSIAKAYVDMLGGKIWVKSEFRVGSTFYFTIPYNNEIEERIIHNNAQKSSETDNQIKGLKILIAEDDEISFALLKRMLKIYSSECIQAITGAETIEICQNTPDLDLIFMDIRMPDLNGYEATQIIRQFNNDIVIIAQTAFALAGDREKAIAAGCNDYLTKPILKADLLRVIKTYFSR